MPVATSKIPYTSVANCSVAESKGKSRFKWAATSAGGVTSSGFPSRIRIDEGSEGGESRRLSVTESNADATP
jgi:hypothetical protein